MVGCCTVRGRSTEYDVVSLSHFTPECAHNRPQSNAHALAFGNVDPDHTGHCNISGSEGSIPRTVIVSSLLPAHSGCEQAVPSAALPLMPPAIG